MSAPRLKIALVVSESPDAEAVRGVLECFSVRVFRHGIGRGDDLVAVLSGEDIYPDTDHLILCCHGHEGKIVMPELGPGVARADEPVGNWGPEEVRRYAKLPPILVLNTGCDLGRPDMVRAFLDSGCRAYVGAADYPEGDAALFFVVRFYYELLTKKCTEREAVELARSQDDQTAMYRYFDKDTVP